MNKAAFIAHLTACNGGREPHPQYVEEQWAILSRALTEGITALNADASDATCSYFFLLCR